MSLSYWFGLVWFGLVWFGLVWFGFITRFLCVLFASFSDPDSEWSAHAEADTFYCFSSLMAEIQVPCNTVLCYYSIIEIHSSCIRFA